MCKTLTACVIARDEEERLPACLQSLGFCDELIVIDSGSHDRTREIAAAAGAKVVENPWRGFAVQRNVALDHATGDWVLEIDADERVSPALGAEISAFLQNVPAGVRMAALPMRDLFLGRRLDRSSRYPRYRHRLFQRSAFRHDESRTVHEGLWPDGETAVLEGELSHVLASTWSEAFADALAYARLEASQRSRPDLWEAVFGSLLRPTFKLAYRLGLYGGWRDGWAGVAKLTLECGADSLATVLRLRATNVADGAGGFGQEPPRIGPVRIVGVAATPVAARRLSPWLAAASAAGADVALIASGDSDAPVRRRALDGRGPSALVRALDAEDQARPIDALLLGGRRERLLTRLTPRSLRGAVPPLEPSLAPYAAVDTVQRLSRSPGPT